MATLTEVRGFEILDSRGNPTVLVEVATSRGQRARAAVPSGASTGVHEAVELRDQDPGRFGGKGVLRAVANVNEQLGPAVSGMDCTDQAGVDRRLCEMDGTPNKARLGANAILGVSMAVARAGAMENATPLYEYLSPGTEKLLPVPHFNILNGGAHAHTDVDFQEFMVAPVGARSFAEALRWGSEVFHALRQVMVERGYDTGQGDEGGFAPNLPSNQAAVELLLEAVARSGYEPGRDLTLALDPATSQLWQPKSGGYKLAGEGRELTARQMVDLWADWVEKFPISLLEDGLAEDDWSGWRELTDRLGQRVQLVGDDIFATNPGRLRRGIEEGVGNSILIKLNQIGTVTETLEVVRLAREAGYRTLISHRSGETTDDFIADLAVATAAGELKSGAPSRGERVVKYNRLLEIERELGGGIRYPTKDSEATSER